MSVKHAHKVKAGDTLSSIANYYGLTIASIMAANPQIDWQSARDAGGLVLAGEKLTLPKGVKADLLPKDAKNSTPKIATRNMEAGVKNIGSPVESSSRVLEFGSKIAEFGALKAYARQADNWLNAEKFYGSVETGWSSANPKLLKFSKLGARVNTGASIVSTGFAFGEMIFGEPQPITYVDAGVGVTGLGASLLSYAKGSSIPGVGIFVAMYGAGRLGWDFGASLAPKYGLINGYYWERNRHLRPRKSIL